MAGPTDRFRKRGHKRGLLTRWSKTTEWLREMHPHVQVIRRELSVDPERPPSHLQIAQALTDAGFRTRAGGRKIYRALIARIDDWKGAERSRIDLHFDRARHDLEMAWLTGDGELNGEAYLRKKAALEIAHAEAISTLENY